MPPNTPPGSSPPYKLSLCPLLVGRAPQVELLEEQLAQASHQARIILVGGEAGIGKTRFVSKVRALAQERGFTLRQGNCFEPDRRLPYAPLLDLVRYYIAAQAPPPGEIPPDLLYLLPEFSARVDTRLPPLEPEHHKKRIFQALTQFLTHSEPVRPRVVLIEDLHWSDETSLEFLLYLARQLGTQPILLLLTYRSDESNPGLYHFLAELDRQRLATEIVLTPLSRSEIEEMIRSIFELKQPVRSDFLDRMYMLTDGNPFFLEETLKSLIASGEIYFANEQWQRKPLQELNIARSVQDAVQRRTEQLGEPAQKVLALAAVAGRRFDFGLLKELSQMNEPELVLVLKQLMDAQLVVEDSADQFAFRHALTRETVYGSLLRRERKGLHRRVGETLEHVHEAAIEPYVADLAYHYHAAGTWSKALEYAQRAGEMAQAMYAPHEAVEQYSRALEAAEQLSTPLPRVLHARGQAYETIGEFEPARADYEKGLGIARALEDGKAEWQALMDLGFLWASRDYTQCGDYFAQALARARAANDPLSLAASLNRIGNWYVNLDQPDQALPYHTEALEIFRQANDANGAAETLDLMGLTYEIAGDLKQAYGYLAESVAHLRALGNQPRLISSLTELSSLGETHLNSTVVPAELLYEQTTSMGKEALKLSKEIGLRSGEAYAQAMLGLYQGYYGDYAQALQSVRECLRLTEEIDHVQWNCFAHVALGCLYHDLFAFEAARKECEHGLMLAQNMGSSIFIYFASEMLALTLIARRDPESAEAVLNAALGPDPLSRITFIKRLCIAALGELELARGDAVRALEIADQLITTAANLTAESVIPRLWKLRGEALARLERFEEAERVLTAARTAAQGQGIRPTLWRIHFALGKLYQLQDRRKEAEVEYAAARRIVQEIAEDVPDPELRATLLQGTDHLLPRPRALSRRRAEKAQFGGVTAREREIAGLIAEGKSNREIADRLVLSERTVAAHIASILSKLGFNSRTQIAVWAVKVELAPKEKK